jgi:hypothetical protein
MRQLQKPLLRTPDESAVEAGILVGDLASAATDGMGEDASGRHFHRHTADGVVEGANRSRSDRCGRCPRRNRDDEGARCYERSNQAIPSWYLVRTSDTTGRRTFRLCCSCLLHHLGHSCRQCADQQKRSKLGGVTGRRGPTGRPHGPSHMCVRSAARPSVGPLCPPGPPGRGRHGSRSPSRTSQEGGVVADEAYAATQYLSRTTRSACAYAASSWSTRRRVQGHRDCLQRRQRHPRGREEFGGKGRGASARSLSDA